MPDDLPGPLAPTQTLTLDGGLYAEAFVPSDTPKGVVAVTHGYAEHCGRYREVANVIVRAGWAALTYDVRGHGQSPGKRGYIEHFSTYLDDLAAAIIAAKKLSSGPLVLLGHSHGSLITLRALTDPKPPTCAAAIVASPYLGLKLAVPAYKKMLARVASKVAPTLAQPNNIRSEDLTHDAAKVAEHKADKLNFAIATARWFTESTEAQAFTFEHASRISVPVTWLVGGADALTDPAQSRRVADRVRGSDYHEYPAMFHEVFNEVGRAEVFGEVTKRLASL
jgi:alpha-beta hydrolase superfamily lysophospholipase